MSASHDLFLKFECTTESQFEDLPLILVVGREPNNPNPFNDQIGDYPLKAMEYQPGKKKRTVAFWDQSYGTVGKTAGLDCAGLKTLAREKHVSPIVFTDVMPTPAEYKPGSRVPRETREATDENEIGKHHQAIFAKDDIIKRVKLVILAGHRHGSFSARERKLLGKASDSFKSHCDSRGILFVETKSMFGNNQPWNLEKIKASNDAVYQINDAVNALKNIA